MVVVWAIFTLMSAFATYCCVIPPRCRAYPEAWEMLIVIMQVLGG